MASIAQAAAKLNRAPSTLHRWIALGAPVKKAAAPGKPAEVDPAALEKWWNERQASRSKGKAESGEALVDALDGKGDPGALAGASVGQMKAAYDLLRIRRQIAREDGELLPKADVEMALAAAFQRFRDRMRSIPDALQRRHRLNEEATDDLRAQIDDALSEAAREAGADGSSTVPRTDAAASKRGRGGGKGRPGGKPARGRQRKRSRRAS